MQKSRFAILGAAASLALLGSVGASLAQAPARGDRLVEVPAGAVILVLPAAAAAAPLDSAFPAMAAPVALMQQIDEMMNAAGPPWLGQDDLLQAAMRNMPMGNGPLSGVVETTISNGRQSCTQRMVYSGSAAAPHVTEASAGNGCAGLGVSTVTPAAAPPATLPAPALRELPHPATPLYQASYRPASRQYAALDR